MTLKERHKKVEENLGLVHACARKFTGKGVDYEDIVSAGCIGLIKAIDSFDETKGFRLSTYAVPAILGEIKRIWRDGGSVKVSRKLKELSIKISRLNERKLREHGRELTLTELSEALSANVDDISEALAAQRIPVSLSQYNDEDEEQEISIPVPSCEESLTESLSLKKAVEELNDKDQALITLRYFKNKTQTATAKELNMTQVQVSRREKKLLQILRNKMDY